MQVLETLKKHQLLANLKKCEFSQDSLVYLGYVIGGGELKIDPMNMEAILKWPVPTNVTKVDLCFGNEIPTKVHRILLIHICATPCYNNQR
jgi:hypothetical protein